MPPPLSSLHLCTCSECAKHVVLATGEVGEQHGAYQTTQVIKAHRRRDALRRAAELAQKHDIETSVLRATILDGPLPEGVSLGGGQTVDDVGATVCTNHFAIAVHNM